MRTTSARFVSVWGSEAVTDRKLSMVPVGDLFQEFPTPKLTDEEWDERDAQIKENEDAIRRRNAFEEFKCRVSVLVSGGAPNLISEHVYAHSFDLAAPAVQALDGFLDDDKRIRVLSGGTGVGKTFASLRWQGDHGGRSPFFLRATELMTGWKYDQELRRKWHASSSMILDDLGSEYADSKGWLTAVLDELIDVCSGRKARTIITTNLKSTEFKERYGERIISRLRGSGRWKSIFDRDRRISR